MDLGLAIVILILDPRTDHCYAAIEKWIKVMMHDSIVFVPVGRLNLAFYKAACVCYTGPVCREIFEPKRRSHKERPVPILPNIVPVIMATVIVGSSRADESNVVPKLVPSSYTHLFLLD